MKRKLQILSARHSLNARSIKQLRQALRRSVAAFEGDETIRFRNRELGNEGYINVAVWYFTELDRAQQEKLLRLYLARLEAYLSPTTGDEARPDPKPEPDISIDGGDPDEEAAAPSIFPARPKRKGTAS